MGCVGHSAAPGLRTLRLPRPMYCYPFGVLIDGRTVGADVTRAMARPYICCWFSMGRGTRATHASPLQVAGGTLVDTSYILHLTSKRVGQWCGGAAKRRRRLGVQAGGKRIARSPCVGANAPPSTAPRRGARAWDSALRFVRILRLRAVRGGVAHGLDRGLSVVG